MNKIFKVIWNHTTQTWIAVSELGKSKTKSKSQTNTTINLSKSLGLISLGTFGMAGTVLGAATADPITYEGTTATPANTLYVTTSDKHVLVGKTAQGGNDPKMNRDEEIVSIGFNTKASGRQTIAIGSNATAAPGQTSDGAAFSNWGESIAIGHNANANAHRGVAIGPDATVEGYPGSVAVGASAKVIGEYGTAVGLSAKTQGHYDIAIGYSASTYNLDKNGNPVPHNQSAYNLAVGVDAHAKNGFSTAVGRQAKSVNQANAFGYLANASGGQSVAVGTKARAIGNNSAAFGYSATAKGWGDIALGLEAKATPNAGGGATALGQSARAFGKESGAIGFGNVVGMTPPAALPTDPTELKTLQDSGLGSFAVGARNNITGIGTFVLGYGVTVNTSSSVVLGDSSSQTGSHTIANVTNATVADVSYSGFAGKVRSVGRFVSVGGPGTAGNERKIINLAAGNISATSTEAINGSQLYLTHKAINDVNNNIPFDYTHKDDDKPLVRLGDKYYKEEDIANLTYDPNTNTFKDNNGRTVTPTAVPENKVNITVKGEPKTVENIAGNLAPTYNKGDLKEGGTDDKPNGQLTDNTSPAYTQRATKPSPEEMKKIYNNAATVGDVLNSGWNLSLNGDSQIDFVKPYDTVNFANGKGTLASVETKDGKVSNVTFNIDNGTATALESGALQGTSPEEKADLKDKADKAKEAADKAQKAVETKETELTKAKEELAKTPDDQAAKDKVTAAETALAEAKAEKANKDSLKAKADRDLLAVDNKVATVENVVSAVNKSGFTIYQDEATDSNKKALVNPGDKVVYKAAGEARVNVSKEKDGTTNITYSVDVPVIYTDEAGNKLIKGEDGKFYPKDALKGKELIDGKYYPEGSVKVGDKIYPAGSVVSGDKAYPAGTELKDDGTPKDPNVAALTEDNVVTPVEPQPGNVIASMNSFATDPKTGKETTATVPMGLSNVAQGTNTIGDKTYTDPNPNKPDAEPETLVKVGDKYYKADDLENGVPKAGKTPVEADAAGTAPVTSAVDKAKAGLADLANSNANNALTVADAKNLGWVVSSNKTTGDLGTEYAADVRNANEVRFVGTGLATVSGETKDNVRIITVDVNAQTVAEKAQLPVVYTDKDGNKLVKGKDGEFYKPEEIADKEYITDKDGNNGKYYPKGSVLAKDGKVYPAEKVGPDGNVITNNGADAPKAVDPVEPAKKGDVIASMNNGNNESKDAPMNLANLRGNLPQTVNVGDTPEKVDADGKTTGELNKDPATKPAPARTERQDAPKAEEVAKIYNNAATVGDVLNAGWNLSLNGDSQIDFVKPYDTVNFANGKGTLASVETKDGKVSNVTFNIDNGTATALESGALQGTSPEEKANLEKAVKDAEKAAADADADVKTKEIELTKAKEALAAVPEGENNNQARQEAQAKVDKAQNALAEAQKEKANKDSLKAKADRNLLAVDNKVATVENVVSAVNKSGFTIYQDEATDSNKKALVNPGDKVVYAAEGLATVTVDKETDAGVTKITYKVDAQAVAETAQLPVVYTDKDGNKLVKGKDGEFYKPEEIADKVFIDGKYYPADSVKANDGKVYPKSKVGEDGNVIQTNGNNPNEAIAVEPYTTSDVIASMNNGENKTITPMSLSNVQGNLPQTVNKGDRKEDPTLKVLTDGKADTATKSAFAPNNIGDIYNNAATVGDVLNSGWNLKNNGEAKDFVKPYDTVNFIDTETVSAKIETNESGLISNVSFSVNTGKAKAEKNGKVVNSVTETDKTEKEADVAQKAEALKTTKADLTTAETTRDEKKTAFDTAKANYDKEQESLKKEKEALAANPSDPLAVGKVKVAEIALKQKADELEKAKKALEEAEDTVDEKQALVDAAQGALDKAKTARAQLDNQVATVKNVVDAINGSGFNIFQDDATDANHKALVNPGDKVVYAAEGLAKVEVTDEQDGVTKITYKVDAQAVAETAQLPVVYTDKDGNKLIKGDDGKFYPAGSVKIDGKYYPAGSAKEDGVVKKDGQPATELTPKATGDVIASMNNAEGSTTSPMALTNIASNLNPTDKVVLNPAGAPQQNPFTDGTKAPELSDALKDATSPLRNNAATIGDVLNAGWNLQGNGKAKDFVRHTDTVNFVNGVGTTVSVTTDDKQKVSEIRVNSLVGLTAQDGTPVIKGDDNKFYKVDAEGKPNKAQPVEASDLVANVINPAAAPNEKGDPLQLGNIAAGAKTFDNEVGGNLGTDPVTLANDGKWYPADQVESTGKPKADATAIPAPKGDNNIKAGLIDFNNSNPNNALTVEDARNLGWIVSTSENQYADQVRNANKVNFKGKDGISVTGETNADGVREITIALKKGEVISSNGEKPKTKDNNTPLTKVGDQYFKTTDVEGGVVKVGDSYYKADDVETKDGVTKPKDNVTALTPITSDNVTSGDAGAGFVTGNQVGDAIQASGFTVGKSTTATLPTTFDNKDEKVNPDDNLRFADGKGIKVSLGTVKAVDNDGVIKTTTTVKVDVDNAKLENNTDGSVKDIADPTKLKALRDAEKKVADAKQAVKDANQAVEDAKKAKADAAQAVIDAEKALTDNQDPAKADELQKALDAAKEKAKDPKLDTAIKEAKDAAAKPELADAVKAAEAELAKNPTANQVATAQNVADAINNSGFTLKASTVDKEDKLFKTGTADKTKGELINPGKTVEMIAGKNMSVKHDKDGKITYATKDDVNFNSVQFGDNGPKIQRDGDNIKVSNSTGGPTKITNVAPGTADTDAVNVKQLKEAVGNINNNFGDINNRVNKLDKRMRGIGANVAAAASLPQVYIPGKSMISAAAGGYNGASAVAVGYSRASDNGKLILKLTGTANSTGQYSGGVGVGYQW